MVSNTTQAELDKIANISPVLVDYQNNIINWDYALTNMQAYAQWINLTNGEEYGTFTVEQNGRLLFTPLSKGVFDITCAVTFNDIITNEQNTIIGILRITVIDNGACNCTCDVVLQELLDLKEAIGDTDIDLVAIYNLAKI